MKNFLEYLEITEKRYPGKPAIASEDSAMSFSELLRLSQIGGSYLGSRGFYSEPIVVFLPKEPQTIAAFFSVVYAGCFYVPIDAGMPLHRIRMILQKLNPRGIICNKSTAAITEELGWGDKILLAEALFIGEKNIELLSLIRARQIDIDPIYLVFTSGSTGMPKGVAACHRSLIDYAEALCPVIGSNQESVFAMQVPLYVDACMKEILSMIRCGSTIWLMPQSLFMMPIRAVEFLNAHSVNSICWVASALTMISGLGAFDDIKPNFLKTICFGSEVFPVKQLHLWQDACPGARFINLYGPTEATGMSFFYEVNRDFTEGDAIPVGKPFNNTSFILLKEDETEASYGETGEICIRGTCVSLGYYDDQERTEKVFVQNPLNRNWTDIVYRTGDLGYLNAEGDLVFVSRKDNQIKNMGHRIELGEIEQCACCCEGVQSACCLWDAEKNKLIMFYMGTAEVKTLQTYLRTELPRHMIPTKFYHDDILPMLPNGKLDRNTMMNQYNENRKQ